MLGIALALFAFGDLSAAMGWMGEVVLGPVPYVFVPVGPVGAAFGGETMPSLRIRILSGPTCLWADIPPPRLGLGRPMGPILLALVWEPPRLVLSWEIPLSPRASIFGALGGESFLGLRLRSPGIWAGGLIRRGELSLWSGFYF